jgi:hypothetical protein
LLSLVAIDMGYGHLRAAQPLADLLHTPLHELDRPPMCDDRDIRSWARTRFFHEGLSRACQWPVVGAPFLAVMDGYTYIPPLDEGVDLSRPELGVRGLRRLIDRGLGARMVEQLRESGATLLTTFFAPAIIADAAGLPAYCVVTDADCHRVWVPRDPGATRIRYLAPSQRVVRRLRAYGVPDENVRLTGFPLPLELLGGPDLPALRTALAARLSRLDPLRRFRGAHAAELAAQLPPTPAGAADAPPLIVFAVGGAGAQLPLAHQLVKALAPALRADRLRLALIAGTRRRVADAFSRYASELGLYRGLEVVFEPEWLPYYRRFNELLARADVLWTKPSEMTFYGALGLPLVLAPPVGSHERYNARWAQENGAGLPQQDVARAASWLREWLDDGVLARAAWAGFRNLPARGVYEIAAAASQSAPATSEQQLN